MQTITFDELLNMPVSDLPVKTQNDAWYDGTKYMHDFAREVMVPVLSKLLKPSEQETAATETYFRMFLLLESIIALNKVRHFQSVDSATRSLFELWLDLEIIARDKTGEAAKLYREFPELERFRVAGQVVKFSDDNPRALEMDISPQRAFHSNPARQKKFGCFKKRAHWTGKGARDRAKAIGQEAMYIEAYPVLSWHVHAGATGTSGMSREALERIFGFSHSVVQRIFVTATSTCAKLTKISALEYFDEWMRGLRLKTGELMTTEQIKLLRTRRQQASTTSTA
jgi:hypothetical protein